MRRIPLALLSVLLVASSARADDGLARVRRTGVLRWGADAEGGPPYVYEDSAGKMVGFEVELADALARELGVRAKLVQIDWANIVPELERGSFDVALNGLEVMPSRIGRVLFTRPYYVFAERLVARRGDRSITGMASLRGKRVGTLTNSQAWLMLKDTGADVVPYDGTDTPYEDLAARRLDAVLLDDIISARFGETNPALRAVADVGEGYYAAAVLPHDTRLRDALDRALDHIARSGELRRILGRWHLDNAREARLVHWSRADDERLFARATAASHLTAHHLWLFTEGAGVTLLVSTLAMAFAVVLGLVLALARLYGPKALGAATTTYIELVRGTPVLLQLYLLYFGIAPVLRLDPIVAAVLGLGLNYAAYEAEVYRAGFVAVPAGQADAAAALGMSTPLALRRVIVPQALRIALPGMTNDFISLLKDSSLVSVVAVIELTKRMTITAVELRSWLVPAALCAAFYFAMSYPLALLTRRLERKLQRA